jgi:hypothetical protein
MMMKRLDWWLGVGVVAIALLAHALLPRYEVLKPGPPGETPFVFVRIDRWFGTLETSNLAVVPWVRVITPLQIERERARH